MICRGERFANARSHAAGVDPALLAHFSECDACLEAMLFEGVRAQADAMSPRHALPLPDIIFLKATARIQSQALDRVTWHLRVAALLVGVLGSCGTAGLAGWLLMG